MTTDLPAAVGETADDRLAVDMYHRLILPTLRSEDYGKYLALDLDTREYEIGTDDLGVTERLHARVPGARVWLFRVGSPTVDLIRTAGGDFR